MNRRGFFSTAGAAILIAPTIILSLPKAKAVVPVAKAIPKGAGLLVQLENTVPYDYSLKIRDTMKQMDWPIMYQNGNMIFKNKGSLMCTGVGGADLFEQAMKDELKRIKGQ